MKPLYKIAEEIFRDWKVISPHALPYARAMLNVADLETPYGADDGRTIVLYFLANAQTWRGETARAVKAELNKMLKQ